MEIVCRCGQCRGSGLRPFRPKDWEAHADKAHCRNFRTSIRVALEDGQSVSLGEWLKYVGAEGRLLRGSAGRPASMALADVGSARGGAAASEEGSARGDGSARARAAKGWRGHEGSAEDFAKKSEPAARAGGEEGELSRLVADLLRDAPLENEATDLMSLRRAGNLRPVVAAVFRRVEQRAASVADPEFAQLLCEAFTAHAPAPEGIAAVARIADGAWEAVGGPEAVEGVVKAAEEACETPAHAASLGALLCGALRSGQLRPTSGALLKALGAVGKFDPVAFSQAAAEMAKAAQAQQ